MEKAGNPTTFIRRALRRFCGDEQASVPVEYGMIAVFISIIAVAVLRNSGSLLNDKYAGILPGLK
jgi:Flp pilus assembly pilin Flp